MLFYVNVLYLCFLIRVVSNVTVSSSDPTCPYPQLFLLAAVTFPSFFLFFFSPALVTQKFTFNLRYLEIKPGFPLLVLNSFISSYSVFSLRKGKSVFWDYFAISAYPYDIVNPSALALFRYHPTYSIVLFYNVLNLA